MNAMATTAAVITTDRRAGFVTRLAAVVVDAIIISAALRGTVALLVLAREAFRRFAPPVNLATLVIVCAPAVVALYNIVCWWLWGRTPGKWLLGLRVVALGGGNALDGGSCYHDYLDPPLTTSPSYPIENGPYANLEPFVPNDDCGDMESGTEVAKTLAAPGVPLRIECTDTNEDGSVDVSVCVSWRGGTSGGQATCSDLSDALPTSSQRCGCTRLELMPEPDAVVSLACGAALLVALAARRAKRQVQGVFRLP
jgi:hypothetical protein